METGTVTLADFLLARIDTDSERARVFEESALLARDALGYPACGRDPVMSLRPSYVRVLADVEAKRRIVAIHETGPGVDWCVVCVEHDYEDTPWPCPTLRVLAMPYADHPDYRDEWRP